MLSNYRKTIILLDLILILHIKCLSISEELNVRNKKNSGQVVFANITIGLQLAITMLVFVYGGHRLDLYFDKSPLFLVIGTALGMALGFYHLLKDLQVDDKKDDGDKDGEKIEKKRIKWN
jgi:F0F1-type ATP synthase assembly protein I